MEPSKRKKKVRGKKGAPVVSKVLGEDWFTNYLTILRGGHPDQPGSSRDVDTMSISSSVISSAAQEEEFYVNIMKDLCEENLAEAVAVHLLTLLEQNFYYPTQPAIIEQTVGSLLNIFSTIQEGSKNNLRRKYLFTITSIMLVHHELVTTDLALKSLFDDFISSLLKLAGKGTKDMIVSTAATECLREIEDFLPGSLNESKLPSSNVLLLSTFLKNGSSVRANDLKLILKSLPKLSPQALHYVFDDFIQHIFNQKDAEVSPVV